ncbi:MAG: sulfatase [Myxococcota bacterium]
MEARADALAAGPDRRRAKALASLAALWAVGCGGAEATAPNLLLLTADSLRADRLGCYGGAPEAGIRICGLAEHGTRYVWALAPSSEGGPAAASILTSRLPSDHGLDARPSSFLRSEIESVAETLTRAGYRTAAFVSSPELLRSRNLDQGFDPYDDRLERGDGARPARTAAHTVEAALAWIDRVETPFAVWIHFGDLHGPYPPPPIPDYEVYADRQAIRLERIDGAVGRLIDHLAERAVPAEVMFAGLHGEATGEDGVWFDHGHSLGLEQVRVPLLWSQGAQGAGVDPNPVSTLDIAPTWLREAGIQEPDGYEGIALPRPGDPPAARRARAIHAEHPSQRAVCVSRFYYVRGRMPRMDARIVELTEDGILPEPGPIDRPGMRTRVQGLERRLAERWGAPRIPQRTPPPGPVPEAAEAEAEAERETPAEGEPGPERTTLP